MTQRLSKIIAIERGVSQKTTKALTQLHRVNEQATLFEGFTRTYNPKDTDGEKFPDEVKRVQVRVSDQLRELRDLMTDVMDVEACRDWGNTVAKADVEVEGVTLLKDVPVTYLLGLERKIASIRTFVAGLPVLDDAYDWQRNESTSVYSTGATTSIKTKKVQRPLVLIPPTKEHQGKAEIITDDVVIGQWTSTRTSGAMPKDEQQRLLQRLEVLERAVKSAREEGNSKEITDVPKIGQKIFDYLFA